MSTGNFETITDVRINDFTIYDRDDSPRLRIGAMEAWMRSTRSLTDTESQFELRLTYDGISVDGAAIEAHVDFTLCSAQTFGAITTAMAAPAGALAVNGALVSGFHPPGVVALSTTGCQLVVPSVGTALFGEFEFKPDYRRVRLLRVKLQSGVFEITQGGPMTASVGGDDGYIVAGAVEGNGSPPF